MDEKINEFSSEFKDESRTQSRRSIGYSGISLLDNRTRIAFNISGKRFETYEATVAKYPNCLLALPQRDLFYDSLRKEYFFDRNRKAFGAILTYCQTGVLVKPKNVDERIFVVELLYFGFDDEADTLFPPAPTESIRDLPENNLQRKVWELFEYPDTSTYARTIALFSVMVILMSIVVFCVETLPEFKETIYSLEKDANGTIISKVESGERTKPMYEPTFFGIECFCIAWFTIEYIVRLLSSPRKVKFLYQVLNIIDLIAILPFYITLILHATDANISSLSILRVLRLVRVFRIFKLSRYSKGLKILGYTFMASIRELGLLAFFLVLGIVLFSSVAYYCESHVKETKFESIPHSFWWAIVTMTTVGYGDMSPETLCGKLVGSFCVLLGVMVIAFPVPVIVNNFAYHYKKEHSQPDLIHDDYLDLPLGRRKTSSTVSV